MKRKDKENNSQKKNLKMRASSGARKHIRSLGGNIFVAVILILVGAFLSLPLVYAVITAIKPIDELFIFPP